MLKKLLFLSILLFSYNSLATEVYEYSVEACLSALYTAQKAHQLEFESFTSDVSRLGLSKEVCGLIAEYEFTYAEENYFQAIAIGHNGEVLGQINSMKELEVY